MKALLTALLLLFLSILPAGAQVTNAQNLQVEIASQAVLGLSYGVNQTLQNYNENGSTTARFALSQTIFVPPNTTDQSINLATLFPSINSAIMWGVSDISSPGQAWSFGMAAGGSRFDINPGGYFSARVNGSAPTIFVDNPSATSYVVLKVWGIAN